MRKVSFARNDCSLFRLKYPAAGTALGSLLNEQWLLAGIKTKKEGLISMNLYSPNIVKNDFHFDATMYSISRHSHEETLSMSYADNDTPKKETVFFIKKAAIHTGIMEILDFDMPEKESSLAAMQKLESALPLFGIGCPFSEDAFSRHCASQTPKDMETSTGQVMPLLQSSFEAHPALSYLYPLYFSVMRLCHLQAGRLPDTELLQTARLLSEEVEVKNLAALYTQARAYLHDVAIKPAEQDIHLPSSAVSEIYHSYCLRTRKNDFQADALSAMEIKTSFLPARDTSPNALPDAQDWIGYLNASSVIVTDGTTNRHPIISFKQFLYLGIRQLLADELVIKKCKLCGGYFRVKYTSNQEYCTRIYRDTSTTCNEYASRKSYKEKLFSHPIHTEFTKSYNRLYARIRRGKLSADTPLMEQLKALHDEYTEKYENTHKKDREAVWKEYIEKNKELLRLDTAKSQQG